LWTRILRHKNSIPVLIGFERAATRIVAFAIVTGVVAALWAATIWAIEWKGPGPSSLGVGGVAGVSAALFAWLKDWLTKPVVETRATTLLRRLGNWLEQATARVLAWIAFVGLFLLIGIGMNASARFDLPAERVFWYWVLGALGVLLATALVFDPARIGLHEFYRTRIARCYLGASNPKANAGGASANRQVAERPGDDVQLGDITPGSPKLHGGAQLGSPPVSESPSGQPRPKPDAFPGGKPVHLICVAANDLTGDHLASLYRGADSAVLSGNGISLGNESRVLYDLKLSSALTASAAAFNSEMGRVSMNLGLAVAFLMSALNLRLGLWIPHPDNPFRRNFVFPGRFFLLELLGRSTLKGRHVHLSDGGHFENLALYELVRRHCRYIVVSDCGQDETVAFDDLANAVRRVREDFGVEIDLDVRPLRPGPDGKVLQHAVIGEIHYDGFSGLDKGSIIYFKPGLTGDEPADILQYQTRCPQFPHETTMNQFYDEPQWESYRRLGEHAGRSVLAFLDRPGTDTAQFVDRMFYKVRRLWQPGPDGQSEQFLKMTERCAELEEALVADRVNDLSREFFREVVELASRGTLPAVAPADVDHDVKALSQLMRLLQVMEDAWVAGDFERYWSHPLNEGWMSYFHRWASAPHVRRWWPILAPIYGAEFRDFAAEQLGLNLVRSESIGAKTGVSQAAEVALESDVDNATFETSLLWRQYVQTSPGVSLTGKTIHTLEIHLIGIDGKLDGIGLPVGFALVNEGERDGYRFAYWNAAELHVPPWLLGSGIMGRLLDAVVKHYETRIDAKKLKFKSIWADFEVKGSEPKNLGGARRILGPAARYLMVRNIAFYKSYGFEYNHPDADDLTRLSLVRSLY
jgi:hypothetical protein